MDIPNSRGADPQNPRELDDRIERSWQAWVDAVAGIPDERLGEPSVGVWSTKDLLGHVAFWEDWAVAYCQRLLAGEPEPAEESDTVGEDQVEERKHASAAEQKRYRDDAHTRLMAFVATIRDDNPVFPRLVEALAGETYDHYDEHTAQVHAWRNAEGI
jgi:hypothetical protein